MLGDYRVFEEGLQPIAHVADVEGVGDLVQQGGSKLEIDECIFPFGVGMAEESAAVDVALDGDEGVLIIDRGRHAFAEAFHVAHLEVALVSEAAECFAYFPNILGREFTYGFVAGVLSGELGSFGGSCVTIRNEAQGCFGLGFGSIEEGIRPVQRLGCVEEPRCQDCWATEDFVVVDVTSTLR